MDISSKILVLGTYRQTLTVIRSLAKTGLHIIVGRNGEKSFTDFSRYTSEVWVHPSIEDQEEEFIDQLMVFLNERKDIQYVFPVHEPEIACIERQRDKLPSSVKKVIPENNTFFTCLDKETMYAMCASVGLPIPETKAIYNLNELQKSAETFGYPVIVKPNGADRYFFGNKALVCRTQQELKEFFPVWPTGNNFIVLQKYINGYRHNCHFYAVDGVVQSYFEHKTMRTDRANGTGVGVDNITVNPSPLLQDYCSNLIKKLQYTGVGCVQFLVLNSGKAYFLEINPRLDANIAMPFKFGYDFPRFAFESVGGQSKVSLQSRAGYPSGKRAHWFMGDIHGLDDEIKRGNVNKQIIFLWILSMFKAFIRADFHITWCWRDPLPTLFLFYQLFKGIIRRFRRVFGPVADV